MLISFKHKFLFVHIPKTGGTSIRGAMDPFRHEPGRVWQNQILSHLGVSFNTLLGRYKSLRFRKHTALCKIERRYPAYIFRSLFKFCFVRNPWDLLVSNYCYLRATKSHRRHQRVSQMTFSEFVEFAAIKRIGFQESMITDNHGNLAVDFVGRFENLSEDFELIARKLGITTTLPHLNQVRRDDYQTFYDRRLVERVREIYQDDIRVFGYEYDTAPTSGYVGQTMLRQQIAA